MQRTIVTLVDDIDGSEEGVETVRFGVDGAQYEIDLGAHNEAELRRIAEPYITHGRKAGTPNRPTFAGGGAKRRTNKDRQRSIAVRRWANEHGHKLGERGRIPEHVTKAANAAGVGL